MARRYIAAIVVVLGFVCTLQLLHLRSQSSTESLSPSSDWQDWTPPSTPASRPDSYHEKPDKTGAEDDDWNLDLTTTSSAIPVATTAAADPADAPVEVSPPQAATECVADTAATQIPLVDLNITITVPDDITYNPEGPRPDQVVLLTASDGKGNNGGIQDILKLTTQNRKEYCDYHGYIYEFINISSYDLAGAHAVWKKIPAIVETFNKHPDAQWVFWLDLDAIIMTPTQDLNSLLLSKEAMKKAIAGGSSHHGAEWSPLGTFQPLELDFENTDLLIAQDHNGVNAGSFLIRRSKYTQFLLDMWTDPFFMHMTWPGREQETLVRL